MLKKGFAAIVCLVAMAAAMSWAATTYQIGTKVNSAGGSIKVRSNATQTASGSVVYTNFTTSAQVPVVVTANSGYTISALTVNGATKAITNPATTVNFLKSAGSSQTLIATFTASKWTVTGAATGAGTITPASASVATGATVVFTATPSSGSAILTGVTGGTVADLSGNPVTYPYGGAVKITVANVSANTAVAAAFASVSVSAGADQVAQVNNQVKLVATTGTGDSVVWTEGASNPASYIAGATTSTVKFTPTVAGTYSFTATEQLGGQTSTVNVVVASNLKDYMALDCNGCHNPAGLYPSQAYNNWSTSIHRAGSVSCVSCHTDGPMPTPVNTLTVNSTTFVNSQANSSGAAGAVFCAQCHTGAYPIPHSTTGLTATCQGCHTGTNGSNGVGGPHGIVAYTAVTMQEAQCQECHAMADPALVAGYNASAHKGGESFESSCAGCHGGSAAAANHPANKTYSTINSVTFVATADIIGGQGTNVAAGTVFCLSCHKGQYPPPHTTDSTQLTTTCANCHTASGTGDAHFIQASGPVTTTLTTCTPCHLNADKTAYVTPAQVDATCAGCHTSSTPHAFQKTTTTSCVVCHLNAINHPGATVADKNDGVRAITGEFQQWSHHIINDINNSQTPRDAQCIMCHLEGKVVNGAVVPDATVHMTNKTIHLRNGNTGIQSASAEYNWDPKSPSHTNMDKFCMSCHNAAGAVTAFANVSSGLKHMTAVPGASAASPLNPFGDLIQNNYDGLSRGAVVAVFDQFDPSNTSHHAVRAARYTASTAGTPGALSSAFSNISASNAAAPAPYTGTNLRYATGTSYVGTMSDTGKFITAYKPLVDNNGTFAPLADNSQLHCGDCHTVGQWAARGSAGFTAYSTAFGAGVTKYYQTQIGAHGSGNEYMLRNSDGNNSLNPMSLVCYNCHAASLYGSGVSSTSVVSTKLFVTSGVGPNGPLNGGAKNPLVSWTLYNYTGVRSAAAPFNGYGLLNNTAGVKNVTTGAISTANAHDGVAGTLGNVHCNDDMNNTAGLTGLARLNSANKTAAAFGQYTNGHYGNGGGANAFGIKCSNCHNSGDGTNAGYGGIHGNAFRVGNTATVITNAAYTTYSSTTAGTGTGAAWATTSHQPYRFLPGLGNFRYNGGSDWTLSKFAVSGRSGCYTLNGSSLSTGPTKIKNAATGRYTSTNMVGNDNGLLGTWGACTEHTNNDHVPTRNILRPTTY